MPLGKVLMITGLGLFVVGLISTYSPGIFGWFGKLPGDIRIEGEGRFLFIPITSMIVLSLALTLIINLFFRR